MVVVVVSWPNVVLGANFRTVHTVKELCQSCFRTECLLDHSMRVAARLYGTLCLLAKHFFVRTRQSRDCVEAAKFDHLVNLVGKSLTVRAYELITHTQVSRNMWEICIIHVVQYSILVLKLIFFCLRTCLTKRLDIDEEAKAGTFAAGCRRSPRASPTSSSASRPSRTRSSSWGQGARST